MEPGPIPFSDAVIDAYIGVIRQAYEANGDRIDPDLGHNDGSFRYLIYQTITHFLPGAMRPFEDVRIEQDNSVFVVRQGAFGLRAYPIGTSEFDDPWTSFPSNRGGAPAAAAQNQDPDGDVPGGDPSSRKRRPWHGVHPRSLRDLDRRPPCGSPLPAGRIDSR